MQVSGQHNFNLSVQQLWDYLMDPHVLAKITPGVTQLKTLSPDQYQSVSDIKIGPVKGSFKGKLNVAEKQAPQSFTINMEQLSKIGNAHVKVNMLLNEIEAGKSQLTFNGKAKLSGVIARTGQRVLSGVANTITKEVFASLEQHIEENKATQNNEQLMDSLQQEPNDLRSTETNQKSLTNRQTASTILEKDLEITTHHTTKSKPNKQTPKTSISLFTRILNFIKQLFGIK